MKIVATGFGFVGTTVTVGGTLVGVADRTGMFTTLVDVDVAVGTTLVLVAVGVFGTEVLVAVGVTVVVVGVAVGGTGVFVTVGVGADCKQSINTFTPW